MKAIVMAGGRGTRLQPLTTSCPKPMVSFVNRPVLDHILNLLKRHHIFDVIITVQYLANQMQNDYYLQAKDRKQLMMISLTNQKIYPVYWLVLSFLALAIDYAMGPFIQFPILFIIPVLLASWYSGRWWGIGLAISLPLFRLYFSMFWIIPWTMLDVGINAAIRMMVLLLIAFLVDRAAAQRRALAHEVQMLRGLLPICSFCKKIRNDENVWERLEEYITQRSDAQFSHGLCPECIEEHYQEFSNKTVEVS